MNSESVEHVLNSPEEEEAEWILAPPDTTWAGFSADEWNALLVEERLFEESYWNLEHEPLSSSSLNDGSDGDDSSSAKELDHDKEEKKNIEIFFNFKLWIRKRNIALIEPERPILAAIEEDVPRILEYPEVKKNAPPEPYATIGIMEQIIFERAFFQLNETYKAVKCLYENIPYITHRDSTEEIRKKIDLKIKTFSYLNDSAFEEAVKIYKGLLKRTEDLFHPLIRKSFNNDFFSLVDIERKCGERHFLKEYWRRRSYSDPLQKRVFQELSQGTGLRDEYYVFCCKQIELQYEFDCYIHRHEKIKHDSCIEDLISDEDVVSKKFKELDSELLRLSLEESIKFQGWVKKDIQYKTYLELLYEKHSKKEIDHIDKMLIEFCTDFSCILKFSLDKALDSAVEERFKDIIDKMQKMWFKGIADHYAVEATLLYMKSIYYEVQGLNEPSWPIAFSRSRLSSMLLTCRVSHEHRFYDQVLTVDFNLA